MEYLTLDLLKQMDDDDSQIAESAEEEWARQGAIRFERFKRCKSQLSKRLRHILDHCYFFHDSFIPEITVQKHNRRGHITYDVVMTMQYDGYDEPLDGWLIHRNIQQFDCHMQGLRSERIPQDYLYGEMFLNEDKLWVHNFIFIDESEINIVCKKIEWVDRKKK